jgi:hypothetical protein
MRISKLNAAQRQLRTAITLWFNNGEPVAIHTLACAAYEILHSISKRRDPTRPSLLFDSDRIKDEYRREWVDRMKKEYNFFKHADRDGDTVIEFNPELSEWFILYAFLARELCGEPASDEEVAFVRWMQVQHPNLLTEAGKQSIASMVSEVDLHWLRGRPKNDFFKAYLVARAAALRAKSK